MTTLKVTIQDDAKAQTLLNVLQLMDFVQIETLISERSNPGDFWEAAAEEVLREEWEQPENDHWDEFYHFVSRRTNRRPPAPDKRSAL